MRGPYGRMMYGVQGAKGAVAPMWLALGIVSRGSVEVPAGIEPLYSIGDNDPVELSEGLTQANLALTIAAVEDFDFLQQVRRDDVTGELDWLSFKLGYHKGADDLTVTVIDAKLDTMTLRCEGGGRLNADFAAVGGKVSKTAVDPGAMSFFGSRAYRWFELVWSETRELRSFELNIRNNLEVVPVIAGTATVRDPERIWDYLDEGRSEISGTLDYFLSDPALDLQDCLLTGADYTLEFASCSDVSPVQVATLTLNGLKQDGETIEIPVDGQIAVRTPFRCTDWSLTD